MNPLAPTPSRTSCLRPLDLILVAVLTAAVFMPNLYGRLSLFDDYMMLVFPSQFQRPTWAGYWQFWVSPSFRIFMPLTQTVWQAIAYFSYKPQLEPQPWAMAAIGFKATSIALHAISAIVATWVLALLTRCRWPAVLSGLLFALHPVQVESVCWTTGMKDVLCGLFALISIGFYVSYLHDNLDSPWKSGRWYASFAAAILSMLSKPTGMMLPLSLIAIDVALRDRPLVRRLPSLWMFFIPALACAAIIHAVQSGPHVPSVPIWARPFVAGDAFAFYLYKLIFPLKLSQDYGRHPQVIWQNGQIWWTWILPAMVLISMLIRRNRLVLLGAALFIIPILPVSGIMPFDMQQYSTPCDHYLYQPMLGVALIAAVALQKPRPWVIGGAIAVLLLLGVRSWEYARLWRRPSQLFETVLEINSRSWMARTVLGGLSLQAGDIAYTLEVTNQSLLLNPNSADPHRALSAVRIRQGRFREAGEEAKRAIDLGGGDAVISRKLLSCGEILHDHQMIGDGVVNWLLWEPGNPAALKTLNDLRRADAAEREKAVK